MFEIPRLKIARAERLFDEFSTIANTFLQSHPYSLGLFQDKTHTHLIGEVRAVPPIEMSLILGDAIHNLRASLDVLANDAVCKQTGSDRRDASFPMARDAAAFASSVARYLPDASTDLVDVVRDCQPFNRPTPWLRKLHDLDIADKHRTTVPVVGNPGFHDIRARQVHTGGTMSMGSIHLDGTRVGQERFMSVANNMNFEFDPNVNHSFFFAIDDPQAAAGERVEAAFKQMRAEALAVIEEVERLFFAPAT